LYQDLGDESEFTSEDELYWADGQCNKVISGVLFENFITSFGV